MPELPEVQTTVNGLQEHIVGLHIIDVWSDYDSSYFKRSDTIKDRVYFNKFRDNIIGSKVISISRRAKNILIHLNNENTILIHMKMTGHLLYGTYKINKEKQKDPWEAIEPEALKDSFNKHVHFVISFSNKKHLALSDVRRFAKVTLIDSKKQNDSTHLNTIGPEPLDKSFSLIKFKERLNLRPNWSIKQTLMDQSIIAGIGNIYADESLWRAGIHPSEKVIDVTKEHMKLLFMAIKTTLLRGIDFGGDSTSDYRNVNGDKGKFHETHHAYQRTGDPCDKKGCKGKISRFMLGSRSTHFCNKHQKLIRK